MLHEDTGRLSSYVIAPRDVGIATTDATTHLQVATAMASNPRDANQLLLAYGASSSVFLWDFAKRKVLREFTLAKPKAPSLARSSISASSGSSISADTNIGGPDVNAPQALAWHASGKRFVAGYAHGGIAVFRADKSHGWYHTPAAASGGSSDATAAKNLKDSDQEPVGPAPIRQLSWICAPPSSKNAHLAGALLLTGGTASSSSLTLVCPPRDVAADDALADLVKSERLTWSVASIASVNCAEVAAFAVASAQVDYSAKIAPLSVLVLSGNPLDGCVPRVSVQPLPCYVRFREHDKEDWEWQIERLARSSAILERLQRSALTACAVVNLDHADGALQDDLFTTTSASETHDAGSSDDFEWPINGGSLVEPLLSRFRSASSAVTDDGQSIGPSATLLLTGHEDGTVLFWDVVPPAERTSKGALELLHVLDVPHRMVSAPATRAISCLAFCPDARVLVVGFATGELAVLEFGHWTHHRPSSLLETHFASSLATSDASEAANQHGGASDAAPDTTGFSTTLSLHIHTQAITSLSLSTAYGYVAAADASGVVSLTHIATQATKLLVFELATSDSDSGEPVSVDSLRMSELVQSTDVPPAVASSSGKSSKSSPTQRKLSRSGSSGTDSALVAQCREVVPILFVGRGNGKLELFHVPSGTKIAESLVDRHKASSLSSILVVDADGKRIEIPGRVWAEQGDGISVSPEDDRAEVAQPPSSAMESTSAGPIEALDNGASATDNSSTGEDAMSAHALHVRSPSAELEYTKQVVLDVLNAVGSSPDDGVLVSSDGQVTWPRTNVIEVAVPPGSLGLHLDTDVEQLAVVKGFVADSITARLLEARGVHTGHVLTTINGVDVAALGLRAICGVLERLREREKVVAFAEGFAYSGAAATSAEPLNSSSGARMASPGIGGFSDLLSDGANHTDVMRPRFLLCTCGRSVHLLQAAIPKASEMALGVREVLAQPLASVDVRAPIVATAVVRVPVHERIEHCVIVLDQSNHLYVLSLLTLAVVWDRECSGAVGHVFDGVHCSVSTTGELVFANAFGEVTRFAVLSAVAASESAVFARKCVRTQLLLPERTLGGSSHDSGASAKSPTKTGGKAAASKGLGMFKKLVAGLKDVADLHRVFQFPDTSDGVDASQRSQLFGDRAARAKTDASAPDDGQSGAAKGVSKGMGDTKEALAQAAQVRLCVLR